MRTYGPCEEVVECLGLLEIIEPFYYAAQDEVGCTQAVNLSVLHSHGLKRVRIRWYGSADHYTLLHCTYRDLHEEAFGVPNNVGSGVVCGRRLRHDGPGRLYDASVEGREILVALKVAGVPKGLDSNDGDADTNLSRVQVLVKLQRLKWKSQGDVLALSGEAY